MWHNGDMHIVVSPLLLVTIGQYVAFAVMFCFAIGGIIFASQWFRHDDNSALSFGMLTIYTLGCVVLAAKLFTAASFLTI